MFSASIASGSKSGNLAIKTPHSSVFTAEERHWITALDIELPLTCQHSPVGLGVQEYFKRFMATWAVLEKMKSVTWDDSKPDKVKVIEIFIKKTQWYKTWNSIFSCTIQKFPEMVKWLEEAPGSKTAVEIWGVEQKIYTLTDLKDWLDNEGKLRKEEDRKGKAKAGEKKKKKKKEDNQSPSKK